MLVLKVAWVLVAPILASAAAVNKHTKVQECLTAAGIPGPANLTFTITPFNLRLPFTPVAVAVPTTLAQVQASVKCGVKAGLKINPKSGGHSYAAHSLGGEDGHFMIDLKFWNSVAVDNTTNIATVGPAGRLGNIAQSLYAQGKRAFSHGTCPGVGVGGHVLHGGYGHASHSWGLALDALVEAQVVLADGSVVIASNTSNPDLFWALRGAGSSYGIVTQYKFETKPAIDQLINWDLKYVWTKDQARQVLDVFQSYANSTDLPREMSARLFITASGVDFWGVYQGTQAQFDPIFNALLAKIPGNPQTSNIFSSDWIDSIKQWAFMNITMPLDYDIHENFYSKSMMTNWISAPELDKFTDYWYSVANSNTRDWYCIIDLHGGPTSAITAVPHDSTSYAHRNALWKFELYDRVANNVTYPAGGQSFLNSWVDTVKTTYPGTLGMYINYADAGLTKYEAHTEYWLDNYVKLSAIKTKYDPNQVFMNPQSVNS